MLDDADVLAFFFFIIIIKMPCRLEAVLAVTQSHEPSVAETISSSADFVILSTKIGSRLLFSRLALSKWGTRARFGRNALRK